MTDKIFLVTDPLRRLLTPLSGGARTAPVTNKMLHIIKRIWIGPNFASVRDIRNHFLAYFSGVCRCRRWNWFKMKLVALAVILSCCLAQVYCDCGPCEIATVQQQWQAALGSDQEALRQCVVAALER